MSVYNITRTHPRDDRLREWVIDDGGEHVLHLAEVTAGAWVIGCRIEPLDVEDDDGEGVLAGIECTDETLGMLCAAMSSGRLDSLGEPPEQIVFTIADAHPPVTWRLERPWSTGDTIRVEGAPDLWRQLARTALDALGVLQGFGDHGMGRSLRDVVLAPRRA